MPDQKTEKTSAQHYEERIEQIQRSHKDLVEMHAIRLEESKSLAHEQETELKAQADGLLGALGRVSAENAELKAKLQSVQADAEHRHLDMKSEVLGMHVELLSLREEKKRITEEAKLLQDEYGRLREELAASKGK